MTEKELLIELYAYSKDSYFKDIRTSVRRDNIKDKIEDFISSENPNFDVGDEELEE